MAKRKEFQEEPYDIFQTSTPTVTAPLFSGPEEKVRVVEIKTGKEEKADLSKLKPKESLNRAAKTSDVNVTPRILPESKVKHSLVLESAEQENEYQAFEARLRQRFGSAVTFSVLGRALFTALLRAEEQVFRAGDRADIPQILDKKNPERAAEYQEAWNRLITQALAASAPIPRDRNRGG